MSNATLVQHAPAAWPVVFRQQFLLLARSSRAWTLALATLGILLLCDYFSAGVLRGARLDARAGLLIFFNWVWVIGLLWGTTIWRDERPARRNYHASLPVDRAVHDATRVAAGAAWLLLAMAAALLLGYALAAWRGQSAELAALGATAWPSYFTTPLLLYLLTSSLAIALNRPLEWLFGGSTAVVVSAMFASHYQLEAWLRLLAWLTAERFGLGTALVTGFVTAQPGYERMRAELAEQAAAPAMMTGDAGTWLAALIVWLVVLSAAVWFAASRRRLG